MPTRPQTRLRARQAATDADADWPHLGPPTPFERVQINRILRAAGYPVAAPRPR